MNKFIILTETMCQGVIPAWFGNNEKGEDRPVVFNTELEAKTEMLEEHLSRLQDQFKEFKNGERDLDEIDIELTDWVESCEINEEGVIFLERGELYNPKTYQR